MKVWIPNASSCPKYMGGKGLFCCRLAKALFALGVGVTDDPKEQVDISLHLARFGSDNAKKRVLRLDGIYHNTAQDYTRKNSGIKASLQYADGVVYQSKHAKRLCDTFLGKAQSPHAIIYNGARVGFYKPYADRSPDKFNVVVFSKWRGHKRLGPMIESFLRSDIEGSRLYVAGNLSKCCIEKHDLARYHNTKNITFLGVLDQVGLAKVLGKCHASMHLCWLDACPNSVTEALCAGVPVITGNQGGCHELLELVGLNDLICDIDEQWDYTPCDLYHPPPVNLDLVASKIRAVHDYDYTYEQYQATIDRAAVDYLNFFESLL